MPEGEEMFHYHGYSGPCPKPPLQPVDAPAPEDMGAVQEVFLRPAHMPREDWLIEHFTEMVLNHMREKQCDSFQAHWVDGKIEADVEFRLLNVRKK